MTKLANRQMSDTEVDLLHVVRFKGTPARMRIRREWGRRCGRKAWLDGLAHDANPFVRTPRMPMHEGWVDGWNEQSRRDATEQTDAQQTG